MSAAGGGGATGASGKRRVVVTGIGLASPIGHDLPTAVAALRDGRHGIVAMPEWADVQGLATRLAGLAKDVPFGDWPRKKVRSMGRVALLATYATEQALKDAGLEQDLHSIPDIGLAYGSTHGSSTAQEEFCRTLFARNGLRGIPSTSYLKFMSNTCVVNLAHFFGIRGRVIATCAACTSGSNAIGYGFEAIRDGELDIMLCGGAEEMHFTHAAVFDILYATSRHYNDRPGAGSRPFDVDRDGLVVAEGACTFVLEEAERARRRGARIHGEVIGFGTSCDGQHVTQPSPEGMAAAMRNALADARVAPEDVDYINAHATSTDIGDLAESQATLQVFGDRVPISSTKGHTGHTLGACGALESAFCLAMMNDGFLAPNRNLDKPDPRCAPLRYVRETSEARDLRITMNNNFAFGGINTSLVFRRA
ncbi:MAG TPA: beta-ketoacyl-ACP synthase [Polyangia bacterium]|nr:beta-ketoacyl-ACP synthase [Polyangia bacterium]